MSNTAENIELMSNEIVNALPFLLDSKVNQAASTVIYNNMEDCLKMSNNENDMRNVSNAFQMCVNYAYEYKINGLMNACKRWKEIADNKLESFRSHESHVEEVSIKDAVNGRLDILESIVNNPEMNDRDELMSISGELDRLEDEVINSSLKSSDIKALKAIRYRIAMLRESLRVSLVILSDMSSVHRLLKSARR